MHVHKCSQPSLGFQKCPLMLEKKKIDAECRTRTTKFLFTEVRHKAVHLVCGGQIAALKTATWIDHYESKCGDIQKPNWCRKDKDIWSFVSEAAEAASLQSFTHQGCNRQDQLCAILQNR